MHLKSKFGHGKNSADVNINIFYYLNLFLIMTLNNLMHTLTITLIVFHFPGECRNRF